MASLSETSISLTHKIPLKERKSQGIYFTPLNVRKYIFDFLGKVLDFTPERFLEPSMGSGEFVNDIITQYPSAKIVGVEYNHMLYSEYIRNHENTNCTVYNQDFIEHSELEKYDCIIGNPPYFVIKKPFPTKVDTLYNESCMGKCNIFVLFLYKCLRYHLNPDGILAFVIPTSFYNSSNYKNCRKYIYDNCTVLDVKNIKTKFIDTTQEVCILIIQNKKTDEHKYFVNINDSYIISPSYIKVNEILTKHTYTNLKEMGYSVKTGNIVWNQIKTSLTDEQKEGHIPLIYSHNVKDKHVDLAFEPLLKEGKEKQKKKYVIKNKVKKQEITSRSIVVSRGYGNSFSFKYGIAPSGVYAENHINVIQGSDHYIDTIYKSFGKPETKIFMESLFGNGAISKTELETIVPIFL